MMGIVVLEELPAGSETLWLKMLSSSQSCQQAFSAIEQLSGSRRERNDILRVCAQYTAYLRERNPLELTNEENAIMKTLEQIDAFFDVEIPAAEERGLKLGEQQGKFQTVSLLVRSRFGKQSEVETVVERMAVLTSEQLDAIATEIFQWQTLADVVSWLERLEP
jgi:competence CoiA-like predicted nuclease